VPGSIERSLPDIAKRQHPALLRRFEEVGFHTVVPETNIRQTLTSSEMTIMKERKRRAKQSWSKLPIEMWSHVLEHVEEESVLWRMSKVNLETRQVGLRILHQRAMKQQEAAAAQLDQAGPFKPLDSRIEEREAQLITILSEVAESVSKEGYQQMRSYRSQPCAAIETVVETCCLILNRGVLPNLDIRRKMAWLLVPAKFEVMQKWISLGDYQPNTMIRQALTAFVLKPELTPEALEHVSIGASQYARWVHGIHDYWEILRKIHLSDHTKYQARHQKKLEHCRKLARLVGVFDAQMNIRAKTAAATKRRRKSIYRAPTRLIDARPRDINASLIGGHGCITQRTYPRLPHPPALHVVSVS